MSRRSELRALARQALAGDARMGVITQISAWAGNISASDLPVLGVVTAQEAVQPESLTHFTRATLLQVVVKRMGGADPEADLDDDADAIEACLCPAFAAQGIMLLPEKVTFTINGDGEQKIATLMADFRVTWQRTLAGQLL